MVEIPDRALSTLGIVGTDGTDSCRFIASSPFLFDSLLSKKERVL